MVETTTGSVGPGVGQSEKVEGKFSSGNRGIVDQAGKCVKCKRRKFRGGVAARSIKKRLGEHSPAKPLS